jgi:hypothetical protein
MGISGSSHSQTTIMVRTTVGTFSEFDDYWVFEIEVSSENM